MLQGVSDKKAKNSYVIPVYWQITSRVKIRANSLEEAVKWVEEHKNELKAKDITEYLDTSLEVEHKEEVIQKYTDEYKENKK